MYSDGIYDDNYLSTIGVDFKVSTIEIDDKLVKMQIWDTAGQERFRSIVNNYYRGAHGVFIVYDVTNRKSFLDASNVWLTEVRRHTIDKFVYGVLIGNKSDLLKDRVVSFDEGQLLANEMGFSFLETSAKNGVYIKEAFHEMAIRLKDRMLVYNSTPRVEKITLPAGYNVAETKKCFC
jgi:Ras-related protein Rab-1A